MPVPDFQTIMLPLLQLSGDGKERSLADARKSLAEHFALTEDERNEVLPSGKQRRFDNRVAWARVYLEKAGLLSVPRRAHFQVTDSGRALLAENPKRIDIALLEKYPPFMEFKNAGSQGPTQGTGTSITTTTTSPGTATTSTPEEQLEESFQSIRAQLASDLLAKVKTASPEFFENLVVELLLKLGYGGNLDSAGKTVGKSGDEGIDGIINEDRLGLDTIYIQAKRWEGVVGRPDIQRFVGALHGKRAKKGVFLTTGTFSAEARQYVESIDPRVILIDGKTLALYMIETNVGVSNRATYELKRIDNDYFVEE